MAAKINPTIAALMARGIDSQTAETLKKNGFTLAALSQKTEPELTALGLQHHQIKAIHDVRAEIPHRTLINVLFNNHLSCCVCRDPSKGVIVHHIEDWDTSRNHDASNLAVLCLDHHDKAHSKSDLTRNLDKSTLKDFKEKWESEARQIDAAAILQASRDKSDCWLYFNIFRLFEIAQNIGVNFRTNPFYQNARACGQIDINGLPISRLEDRAQRYNDGMGLTFYFYVKEVMQDVLSNVTIINISDVLDRGTLRNLIQPGDLVFVQGAHSFKRDRASAKGPGQMASGQRAANGVRVQFVFDRWDATSMSAYAVWLSGRKSVSSLLRVGNIDTDDGELVIDGTALGIAMGFSKLKTREYGAAG